MYRFRQYLLRKTKIRFIVSARCTNTVTMDRFPKLAKFPGLTGECILLKGEAKAWHFQDSQFNIKSTKILSESV